MSVFLSVHHAQRADVKRTFMSMLLFGVALFLPDIALASGGFSAGLAVPSAYQEKPMLELIGLVFFVVIMIGIVATIAFGGMTAVAHIFASLKDSAREGDFGPLIRYIIAAVVVVTMAVVLAGLAWGWLSNSTFKPNITIG